MQLGDSREGKLADNMAGFGRALRRAGVRVDASRMSLAQEAALQVGLASKVDVSAALEAVLISSVQDRAVFRELFDAYFQDPNMGAKLLSQMLPSAEGKAEAQQRRARVREALAPQKAFGQEAKPRQDKEVEFDAAMTAGDIKSLKNADFNQLTASEYRLVERLAKDIALPLPCVPGRRNASASSGARLHWRAALHSAARTGGELMCLPELARRQQSVPVLLLLDVSGSMERYARMMLSFLHTATREFEGQRVRRDVFAIGTSLTDLSASFKLADTDDMLAHASNSIADFAGGTQLGKCLQSLRQLHARRLVGRRSVVLLVSDGLDTGDNVQLAAELAWLKRRCRRLLWLNPLLRFDGYAPLAQGAAALHHAADGMLAIHNLTKLEDLATSLAQIFKPKSGS
jgi:uncharacterized protein